MELRGLRPGSHLEAHKALSPRFRLRYADMLVSRGQLAEEQKQLKADFRVEGLGFQGLRLETVRNFNF